MKEMFTHSVRLVTTDGDEALAAQLRHALDILAPYREGADYAWRKLDEIECASAVTAAHLNLAL